MFVAKESVSTRLLNFAYVLPHPPQDVAHSSPFQGFTPGIMSTSWLLRHIAAFPRSLIDLVGGAQERASHRIADGAYSVFPLEYEAAQVFLQLGYPFVCICSGTADIAQAVEQDIVSHATYPVLHITPTDFDSGIPIDRVDTSTFWEHALEVAGALEERHEDHPMAAFIREGLVGEPPTFTAGAFVSRSHNLTAPNESALRALGFLRKQHAKPLVGHDNRVYFDAMRDTAQTLWRIRTNLIEDNPVLTVSTTPDLVLAAPATFSHVSKIHKRLREDLAPDRAKILKQMLRQIVSRDTYNFTAEIEGDVQDFLKHAAGQGALAMNARELSSFTDALCIRASSSVSPVLRFPPAVNNVRHDLTMLGSTAAASGPRRAAKMSRLASGIATKLAASVPSWAWDMIGESRSLKIVADTPLEWLPLDGVPMMLRKETSRIPATPGNLMFGETAAPPQLVLPESSLDEVLVVSSFQSGDPIRKFLRSSLKQYSEAFVDSKPGLIFESVQTEQELIAVLNDYDGAMMIYDGHGAPGRAEEPGSIQLAAGQSNGWTIRGRARIPPIVLLSTCDSHSVRGSYATTANGFLAAGAVSVMATMLPVHAMYAGITVGRLLLRLSHFRPMLLNRPFRSFRWSEILPMVQVRQYLFEALTALDGHGGEISVPEQKREEILLDLSYALETEDIDWYESLLERVRDATGYDCDSIRQELTRKAFITEALLYLQLGNPEHLVFVPDEDHIPLWRGGGTSA